jgi:hypothetical protein
MPRLRPRTEPAAVPAVEWVICVEGFRTAAVGPLIAKGEKYPITDPIVQRHPAYFRGLVDLTPEILSRSAVA